MSNGSLARTSRPDPALGSPAPEASDRELLERFHRLRDQAAFERLVRRHGPMVLGVCRRVLIHTHDAEDAFQATFMVLVRKAGSLRDPELLANYLYGVAYRVARKSRARIARQAQCERRAVSMPAEDVYYDLAWRELRGILDEELQTLPAKYQAPLVLCYLEGLSNEEAARRLGWPTGSISYRLAKGRELLRQRLARRDKAFSVQLFTTLLGTKIVVEALPDALLQSTVRSAVALAASQAAVGAGFAQTALKALVPDTRSAVIVGLLLLLSLGVAASVVARGVIDTGSSHKTFPTAGSNGAGSGAAVGGEAVVGGEPAAGGAPTACH
jgi:RNA polymerase sigma factor (sigma-70 family)